MNTVLFAVACVLMLVSIALFFRHNQAETQHEKTNAISPNSPRNALLSFFVVAGILVSFGGFWIEWMLWLGIILIEVGCVAHYVRSNRPNNDCVR
jgi:low temperature requirement protein LtrA